MKESISNVLQHPWLTKKRKIMLGALLVFMVCSSVYKFPADPYSGGSRYHDSEGGAGVGSRAGDIGHANACASYKGAYKLSYDNGDAKGAAAALDAMKAVGCF